MFKKRKLMRFKSAEMLRAQLVGAVSLAQSDEISWKIVSTRNGKADIYTTLSITGVPLNLLEEI